MHSAVTRVIETVAAVYGIGFLVVMFSAIAMLLRRFTLERRRGASEDEAFESASHATRRAFGIPPDTIAGDEADAYEEDKWRSSALAMLLDEPDNAHPRV